MKFSIRNGLNRFLPSGKFGRNTAVMASSTAFGQGVGIIAAPLLTRLYVPYDLGIVAVYSSISSIFSALTSLRYEWAVPIAKDDRSATHLLALSLQISLVLGLLMGLGIWLVGSRFINMGYMSPVKHYLWLLLLGLPMIGSYQALNAWAIRKKEFETLAKTKVKQSLCEVIVQLGLGVLKAGPIGLLLGNLLSQVVGVKNLAVPAWRKNEEALRAIKCADLQQVAYRYRQFPLFSTGSSLLNIASLQLMPILLGVFYGPTAVGWFALSQRVIGMPTTLIGGAVSQTFWAEASHLIHNDPKGLQALFYRLTKKLLVLSAFVGLIGAVSPWVFGIVFGEQRWAMAGIFTLYLTPMFATQFVVSALSHLSVHELQHWQFIWDAARLIFTVTCLWIGYGWGWPAGVTLAVYSLLMSFMYGVLFIMNVYALRLKIRMG